MLWKDFQNVEREREKNKTKEIKLGENFLFPEICYRLEKKKKFQRCFHTYELTVSVNIIDSFKMKSVSIKVKYIIIFRINLKRSI